jgi:hypothetical protein
VIAGTTLAGIPGALLAVPLVAFLNSSIHALRRSPDPVVNHTGTPLKERTPADSSPDDEDQDEDAESRP